MKKPLHLLLTPYSVILYRQHVHAGETYWKGIGGLSHGGNLDHVREYCESVKANNPGRDIAHHASIPQGVHAI